jgi:glycerol-3-phosphate dehydrogenase
MRIAVVGSGIAGLGAAGDGTLYQLARNKDVSVLAIDQGSFAAETTSKTSKFIHAGVWYEYMAYGHFMDFLKLKGWRHLVTAIKNMEIVLGGTASGKDLAQYSGGTVVPQPFTALIYRNSITGGKLLTFAGLLLYDLFGLAYEQIWKWKTGQRPKFPWRMTRFYGNGERAHRDFYFLDFKN